MYHHLILKCVILKNTPYQKWFPFKILKKLLGFCGRVWSRLSSMSCIYLTALTRCSIRWRHTLHPSRMGVDVSSDKVSSLEVQLSLVLILLPIIRVSTVPAFLEGPVLRSFSPKRLRTGPGPVLKFSLKLNG